jgi:pyrrolidone-carboxylate peptidase
MMRTFGVFLVSLAFSATVSQATSTHPFRLVLTSFDPFGMRSKNNTQPIAKAITAMAPTLGDDVEVVTCNLPVVYDEAAKAALDCISHAQPDAVVSLGEGYCDIRIETGATNWDNSRSPDNADQLRSGSPILASGPARSAFGFPVQAMYCALENPSDLVHVSADPGSFVCNNTAYLLSLEFNARHIPFTFIHVPHTDCHPEEKNVVKNAKIIATMLSGAITNLRAPAPADSLWPHSGSDLLIPATQEAAQNQLSRLQTQNAPACEQAFAQELISTSWPRSIQKPELLH